MRARAPREVLEVVKGEEGDKTGQRRERDGRCYEKSVFKREILLERTRRKFHRDSTYICMRLYITFRLDYWADVCREKDYILYILQ